MELIDLAEGEHILMKTHRSWLALVPVLFTCVIACGICIGIGVGLHFLIEALLKGETIPKVFSVFFDGISYVFYAMGGLLFILRMAKAIISIKCDYLVLTNKRLYGRKGFLSKSTYDTVLEKIDTVRVENSLSGRIFHFASIEIVSPASTKIENGNTVYDRYEFIANTEEFRKAVIAALEQAKKENAQTKQNEN